MKECKPHVHADEKGVLHTCYHRCRTTLSDWGFWVGITLTYPLEHFLWEHVPPFSWILSLMGL